jgi:Fic family protein
LLLILLLCAENVLPQPMLYLSAYFERHREKYYQLLLSTSQDGRWSEWVSFFLRGVAEQSRDAIKRSEKLLALWHQYRKRVQAVRSSALPLILVDELFKRPYLTFSAAREVLGVTFRSAQLNVRKLIAAGILKELPGRSYGKIFIARDVLDVLEAREMK